MTYAMFQVEKDAQAWLRMMRDQGYSGYVLSQNAYNFEVRIW